MALDKKRYAIEIVAFLVVVALVVTFTLRRRGGSDEDAGRHADYRFMMGTIVSVTVLAPDADAGSAAIEAAFGQMEDVEALTTRYSDDSEITKLNAQQDGYVGEQVSREVAEVVAHSLAMAEASGGAFDITVAPLMDIWTGSDGKLAPPDEASIREALLRVDWSAVRVDTAYRTMTVLPGIELDLAGSAKGYAVDRAVAALEKAGVDAGVVDAGGDVGFAGRPPDERGWRVGVQHPRGDGLLGVVTLDGGSVATSGDYQNFVVIDGVRYHHILDPSTGYPARGVMSVTVATELAVTADALATAVFVLGPEDGMDLIERTPGAEALLITGDGDSIGQILTSSGLAGRFVEQ